MHNILGEEISVNSDSFMPVQKTHNSHRNVSIISKSGSICSCTVNSLVLKEESSVTFSFLFGYFDLPLLKHIGIN